MIDIRITLNPSCKAESSWSTLRSAIEQAPLFETLLEKCLPKLMATKSANQDEGTAANGEITACSSPRDEGLVGLLPLTEINCTSQRKHSEFSEKDNSVSSDLSSGTSNFKFRQTVLSRRRSSATEALRKIASSQVSI
jgi:hypothetical protein